MADLDQAPEPEAEAFGGAGESSLVFSEQGHEPSSGILLRPERGDDAATGS
jgi:hypothetical protein